MEIKEIIKTNLDGILSYLKIKPEIEINEEEDGGYSVSICGDDLNFLIGFRGQSLEALQNILRLMVFRQTQQQLTIIIDINDYRDRKAEKIQDMARSYIDKVRFFQKEVEMPRMNSWERRQIHVMVSEYDDITSESTGEGDDRRVVLKLKEQNSKEEKE
jgi:spoIIIJ-associated protein